jgi:hypothetical protein
VGADDFCQSAGVLTMNMLGAPSLRVLGAGALGGTDHPPPRSTRGRVGEAAGLNRCGGAAGAELDHSPNTYNTVALRCSLSSGALAHRRLPLAGSVPDAIATYCLPLTSKVMGGAEKAAEAG